MILRGTIQQSYVNAWGFLLRRRKRSWIATVVAVIILHRAINPFINDAYDNIPRSADHVAVLQTAVNRPCWHLEVPSSRIQPKQFMEKGAGLSYLPLYRQLEGKKRMLRVRFVRYNWTSTCQPVYFHIHKIGGTAMNVKNRAMVDAYYTPREQELGSQRFREQALVVMESIRRNQQAGDESMPLFTFLRDPVPRFMSSVSQALQLNRLKPCNIQSNSTITLIECVLQKIHDKQSFLDEHLVPQAFELYSGVMGLDLRVTVMDMTYISTALSHLGIQDNHPRRMSPQVVQGFNLSLSLLTPTLLSRICQTYKVDVLLLRETGVTKTMCESVL